MSSIDHLNQMEKYKFQSNKFLSNGMRLDITSHKALVVKLGFICMYGEYGE